VITLVFNNKALHCPSSTPIYQYEKNIDNINCIIPMEYNGQNLNNAEVLLFYKNSLGKGSFIRLDKSDTPYDSTKNLYVCKVETKLTAVAGDLTLWLKIIDDEQDISFETTETTIKILPSKTIPKDKIIESYSYLDQKLIEMKQICNAAIMAKKEATEQANIVRQLVRQIIGGENTKCKRFK